MRRSRRGRRFKEPRYSLSAQFSALCLTHCSSAFAPPRFRRPRQFLPDWPNTNRENMPFYAGGRRFLRAVLCSRAWGNLVKTRQRILTISLLRRGARSSFDPPETALRGRRPGDPGGTERYYVSLRQPLPYSLFARLWLWEGTVLFLKSRAALLEQRPLAGYAELARGSLRAKRTKKTFDGCLRNLKLPAAATPRNGTRQSSAISSC